MGSTNTIAHRINRLRSERRTSREKMFDIYRSRTRFFLRLIIMYLADAGNSKNAEITSKQTILTKQETIFIACEPANFYNVT